MAKIINVLTIPGYRHTSNRYKWYEQLVRFDGKPIEEFMESVEHDPPTADNVSSWILFFEEQGVLKLTSDAEYTKYVHLYSEDPYGIMKDSAWFLWRVGKWLVISGVFVLIVAFYAGDSPRFAVFMGIMLLFIVFAGFIVDAAHRSAKKEEKFYVKE